MSLLWKIERVVRRLLKSWFSGYHFLKYISFISSKMFDVMAMKVIWEEIVVFGVFLSYLQKSCSMRRWWKLSRAERNSRIKMSLNGQDDRESKFRSVFGASYRTTDRSEARRTFFRGVMHAVVENSREGSSRIGCRRRSSRNQRWAWIVFSKHIDVQSPC